MKVCILFLTGLILTIACNDTIKVIKGCCDEPAVVSQGDVGWVYIPNVFTPNGDGLHDYMIVQGDSLKQLIYITIKNEQGATVYNASKIPINDYVNSWDGTFNGKVQRGMYSYEIRVESITGYVWEVKGNICNCPCDQDEDEDIAPIRNCEFGWCDPQIIDCNEDEGLSCFEN